MRIPHIFHHIWFGSELPDQFKEYIRTWKRFHPGWSFMFWDEENLPELTNKRLFDKARTYAEQSDIVRIEVLEKYGGIYVDTDYECLNNITPLIRDSTFFIICDRKIWKLNHPKYHIPYLNNAFMGCTPNHPLVNKLIEELPGFYKKNRRHHVCFRTGPGFVSQILYKKPDILLLDHNLTTQKYAKHHYVNSWESIEPQPQFWPLEKEDKPPIGGRIRMNKVTLKDVEKTIKRCLRNKDNKTALNYYNNYKHLFKNLDIDKLKKEINKSNKKIEEKIKEPEEE